MIFYSEALWYLYWQCIPHILAYKISRSGAIFPSELISLYGLKMDCNFGGGVNLATNHISILNLVFSVSLQRSFLRRPELCNMPKVFVCSNSGFRSGINSKNTSWLLTVFFWGDITDKFLHLLPHPLAFLCFFEERRGNRFWPSQQLIVLSCVKYYTSLDFVSPDQ